jgi:hypothetical protein
MREISLTARYAIPNIASISKLIKERKDPKRPKINFVTPGDSKPDVKTSNLNRHSGMCMSTQIKKNVETSPEVQVSNEIENEI